MVTEVVVKHLLSDEMITAGAELTRLLAESGFGVKASRWLYMPEAEEWRFVITTPEVLRLGPRSAYKHVQSVLAKMQKERISLEDISIVDSDDPLLAA